jgi:hypothetical protein
LALAPAEAGRLLQLLGRLTNLLRTESEPVIVKFIANLCLVVGNSIQQCLDSQTAFSSEIVKTFTEQLDRLILFKNIFAERFQEKTKHYFPLYYEFQQEQARKKQQELESPPIPPPVPVPVPQEVRVDQPQQNPPEPIPDNNPLPNANLEKEPPPEINPPEDENVNGRS